MGVSIGVSIKQNSQNIPDYKSNVTVAVTVKWDSGSYNANYCSGSVTINGTKYSFSAPFNAGQTTSGTDTMYSKTLDVEHDAATGKKTVSVSATYEPGSNWGTKTASGSLTLAAMPLRYALSISAGTGAAVSVNRDSSPSGLIGRLSGGDALYAGDVLTITFSAVSLIYQIKTHTVNGETFASGGTHTVSGDVSVVAAAKKRGVMRIDTGTEIVTVLIWLDLGTKWAQLIAYIDGGTAFRVCG